MKQGSTRAQIRQLCCMGLAAETLMPRLLPMLRQLVPAESAGFFWVDSSGAMQNLYAERMLSANKMQLYFDHFYEGGEFDFKRSFQKRAQAKRDVATLAVDSNFKQSAYYNEILRDLDAHHVLHGIVRGNNQALGQALGQISLYRPTKSVSFTAANETDLQSVLHYVSHAIAAPLSKVVSGVKNGNAKVDTTAEMLDTADDAVILITREGALMHASEAGRRLLVQAVDGAFSPTAMQTSGEAVSQLLKQLVHQLLRDPVALPVCTQNSRWGRIALRAYSMESDVGSNGGSQDSPIAIRITRQEPMLLRFAHAMQTLDLSPQVQETALHLAQGHTNGEIAEQMNITVNTVSCHIKSLFAKLGTHGRIETVQHILAQPKK